MRPLGIPPYNRANWSSLNAGQKRYAMTQYNRARTNRNLPIDPYNDWGRVHIGSSSNNNATSSTTASARSTSPRPSTSRNPEPLPSVSGTQERQEISDAELVELVEQLEYEVENRNLERSHLEDEFLRIINDHGLPLPEELEGHTRDMPSLPGKNNVMVRGMLLNIALFL